MPGCDQKNATLSGHCFPSLARHFYQFGSNGGLRRIVRYSSRIRVAREQRLNEAIDGNRKRHSSARLKARLEMRCDQPQSQAKSSARGGR
jgi:hypothetical protein